MSYFPPVCIESLCPRRFCSGDPDLSFGDKGVADLPLSPSHQVPLPVAGDGFYFAQQTQSSETTTITKLTAEWQLEQRASS